jgi:hypothetical protein
MHLASGLDRPVHDILYQVHRIKVLYTGGQAIDRVIVISQIAQIKADEAQILELQPRIQIARVPNAGHMIPWDDLEGFFAAFGDFLGQPLV